MHIESEGDAFRPLFFTNHWSLFNSKLIPVGPFSTPTYWLIRIANKQAFISNQLILDAFPEPNICQTTRPNNAQQRKCLHMIQIPSWNGWHSHEDDGQYDP